MRNVDRPVASRVRFHMTEVSMKADYRLWTHPVVVGSGQRLVRDGDCATGLRLLDREAFNAEVVVLAYQPARTADTATTPPFEDWRPAKTRSISDLAMAMLGISAESDQEP
jgi:hypothetical protein